MCAALYLLSQCHLNAPAWKIANERAVSAYILYNARREIIHYACSLTMRVGRTGQVLIYANKKYASLRCLA